MILDILGTLAFFALAWLGMYKIVHWAACTKQFQASHREYCSTCRGQYEATGKQETYCPVNGSAE